MLSAAAVTNEFEHGWRAYLTADEEDDPVAAVVLCPDCSDREFGLGDKPAA